ERARDPLAASLAEAGAPTRALHQYARERRLWVYSAGASRGDVLAAVGRLWGWTLSSTRGRLRLGRPAFAPATDPVDLHQKMQAALPPGLRPMISAVQNEAATDPWGQQMDRILEAVEHVGGKDWREVRVENLDETAQRRLANQVARTQAARWFTIYGNM